MAGVRASNLGPKGKVRHAPRRGASEFGLVEVLRVECDSALVERGNKFLAKLTYPMMLLLVGDVPLHKRNSAPIHGESRIALLPEE